MKPMIKLIIIIAAWLVVVFAFGIFITNGVSYVPAPHPSTTFTRK